MKEQLQKRIADLMMEREATIGRVNVLTGCIQECQRLLDILDLERMQKPTESGLPDEPR